MADLQQTTPELLTEFLPPLPMDLPATGQTCRWVIAHNINCGATVSANSRLASAHLRNEHAVDEGNADDMVSYFVTEGNVTHMSRWWKYEYDGIIGRRRGLQTIEQTLVKRAVRGAGRKPNLPHPTRPTC
ncbi:hypothetical protein V8E55_012113 [Tylopilus felleus]